MSDSLTELQRTERSALTGDRMAVARVVSALREYRAAVQRALDLRWGDGAIDGAISHTLAGTVESIESGGDNDD